MTRMSLLLYITRLKSVCQILLLALKEKEKIHFEYARRQNAKSHVISILSPSAPLIIASIPPLPCTPCEYLRRYVCRFYAHCV